MTAQQVPAPASALPVPPLRPDPEIMDNAEGNERLLKQDRESAIAFLDEQERDAR